MPFNNFNCFYEKKEGKISLHVFRAQLYLTKVSPRDLKLDSLKAECWSFDIIIVALVFR